MELLILKEIDRNELGVELAVGLIRDRMPDAPPVISFGAHPLLEAGDRTGEFILAADFP